MQKFEALVVNQISEDFKVEIKELSFDDLPEGDVTIQVKYSCVNFKDGLAAIPNGNIVKTYPFIPGIDLAGTVAASRDSRYREGDDVLITGFELGVSHFGDFSQYARVPGDWIVPLPDGLSLKEAMFYGTAGFTTALGIQRLEDNGLNPEKGPVLVTGATGGVGSLAVAMFAKAGYEVFASTGKEQEHDYLRQLGASEILSREDVSPEKIRPLDKQRFAGAVDPVGGKTLAYLLSATSYGGSVAVCGLTGGTAIPTNVFPFILRGVNLLGIDSVHCTMDTRLHLWDRMTHDLKPDANLAETILTEVSLSELPDALSNILKGKVRGRVVVKL